MDIDIKASLDSNVDESRIVGTCGNRGTRCFHLRHTRCPIFRREVIKLLDKYMEHHGGITPEQLEKIIKEVESAIIPYVDEKVNSIMEYLNSKYWERIIEEIDKKVVSTNKIFVATNGDEAKNKEIPAGGYIPLTVIAKNTLGATVAEISGGHEVTLPISGVYRVEATIETAEIYTVSAFMLYVPPRRVPFNHVNSFSQSCSLVRYYAAGERVHIWSRDTIRLDSYPPNIGLSIELIGETPSGARSNVYDLETE